MSRDNEPEEDRTVRGRGSPDPSGGPAPGTPAAGAGVPPGHSGDGANTASGEDAGQAADIDRLNAGNVPTHEDPVGEGGDEGALKPPPGRLGEILSLPNDDPKKTVLVAVALCLVCSILVSGAAVLLRPAQETNAELDRKRNILEVAGLLETERDADTDPDAPVGRSPEDVETLFDNIERRIVDLETGEFTDEIDAETFDARVAAADPEMGILIDADKDIAKIGRRAKYAEVYMVRDGEALDQIILPVHGLGLWSTLYGFIALEEDLTTIAGLKFYDHAETPGLGGEVDNVAWRRKWEGKVAFDDSGDVAIEVVKGTVPANAPDAAYSVDGLAGATLTSQGVTNLLRYWLDEEGFGRFLANLGEGAAERTAAGEGVAPLIDDTEGT